MLQACYVGLNLNHNTKNPEVINCGKNCVRFPYFLKASLYQFKQVNNFFLLKTPLTDNAIVYLM